MYYDPKNHYLGCFGKDSDEYAKIWKKITGLRLNHRGFYGANCDLDGWVRNYSEPDEIVAEFNRGKFRKWSVYGHNILVKLWA